MPATADPKHLPMNPTNSPKSPAAQPRTGAILVTGADGELGHALLCALREQHGESRPIIGFDLRPLDAVSAGQCTRTIAGDVSDGAVLASAFDPSLTGRAIDEVWHLAALLSSRSEQDPALAFKVNLGGSAQLLELAAQPGMRRGTPTLFMFPSTIAVYGMPSLEVKRAAGAISEDQFTQSTTVYGVHKRAVEELGRYTSTSYRMLDADRAAADVVDFRAIRFPGIISADTVPSGGTSDFGPEMLHAAAQGKPYACFVRADSRIPFMTMPDAVRAIMELAAASRERLTSTTYNVSGFAPSAAEIATQVTTLFPAARISYSPNPLRQAIVDSWPEDCDDSAARRDWGWIPEHDLAGAFRDYLGPAVRARYA
ncbi:MAG: NAD-dependent epimerase/dehydratase family protein [Planctomycetota bacterium]|nr:NAD-dependent epimerase/dehydratase family protein [Planctomycetota bacterium]MDA1106313.1 NAD-dependent epimerase/dehydratase family protein [Planctomycetota bacterium]